MHLIAFSFEAASDGNLSPLNKYTSRLSVNALLINRGQEAHMATRRRYYFSALIISKKFPRLLAEREIIANA